MRPDDASLTPDEYAMIRRHAQRALEGGGGFGRFPTPVADVMAHAKVVVAEEESLDDGFLGKMRRRASGALRRALSKVLGVLDIAAGIAYIDRTVHAVKQTFLKLHETGHAALPHQRSLYSLVEDCAMTIAPEVSEQFDREANVFAAEVLFQLDTFSEEANSEPFGIKVPMKLSRKYGASIYASVRQYVSKSSRACCVLVIDPPVLRDGAGFTATLRRVVVSHEFEARLGQLRWPESFTPADDIGAAIPVNGRRMSRPRTCSVVDEKGSPHECVIEAFTQGHQVFVLILETHSLTAKTVVMPLAHGAGGWSRSGTTGIGPVV